MNKLIAFILSLCLCAFSFCFTASAAKDNSFGNLSWSLEDGVLTISGNGPMDDLSFFEKTQWRIYDEEIIEVIIEEGVTSVGNVAFLGCKNLQSVTLPRGISVIGEYAFQSCTSITAIHLPESTTTLMSGAFSMCTGLKTVSLPEGISTMEEAVFEGCSALESVSIKCAIEQIPPLTFDGCDALEAVKFFGTEEEWEKLMNIITVGNEVLRTVTVEYAAAVKGDVNMDGSTDNLDAAYVLRHNAYLIELTGDALANGDVNGSDTVDSLDAALILKYDAGLIDSFDNY